VELLFDAGEAQEGIQVVLIDLGDEVLVRDRIGLEKTSDAGLDAEFDGVACEILRGRVSARAE
jgi:hypothetical protein